jgi:hypothetical protein
MKRIPPSPALAGAASVIEIERLARVFAGKRVAAHVADDIAQDAVLESLVKIRAGWWTVRHANVEPFVKKVVGRHVVEWLRRRDHGDECNAEYARGVADRGHTWMEPEPMMEDREMAEMHEQTLCELSTADEIRPRKGAWSIHQVSSQHTPAHV